MIDANACTKLPYREEPNCYYHKEEFAPNSGNPKLPKLSGKQQNASLRRVEESYGKV
jgi:hypothetical protein